MISRRALCALAGVASAGFAGPAVAQSHHSYGQHPRQTLQLFKGHGRGQQPLVLMVGDAERASSLTGYAQRLAALGMMAAVMDRRPARHGFNAHQSDVAKALVAFGYVEGFNGEAALWGQDSGADAVLLMMRDRRYLSAVGLDTDVIKGAVLVGATQADEPTFTQSSAYGLNEPPAIYRTSQARAVQGVAFLSGLL